MLAAKSTSGFYDRSTNPIIPDDAVEISDELYTDLINGPANGKMIAWGEDGVPFLVDQPEPTAEELNEIADARRNNAYRDESDQLFFQYQREEVDKQVWLDKVAEIKLRYPKV